MLQTSTTDSEINILQGNEMGSPSVFSVEDQAFYSSIKEELNTLFVAPPDQVIDHIINYSRSL